MELRPTQNQEELITSIINSHVTICAGPSGTGKAQPLDATVYTPKGPAKMGELKVGDRVSTPNGKSAKVLGIFPQGETPVYQIWFSDNSYTECCGQHLWKIFTQENRSKDQDGSIWTTEQIIQYLEKYPKASLSIPQTKPVEFDKQDVNISPYILGALIGDGSLTGTTPCFTTKDKWILEKFTNERRYNKFKIEYTAKKDGMSYYLRSGGKLQKELKKLNLNTTSYYKHIPDCYKYNTVLVRKKVLQGLMDTDGTTDGYNSNFCTTSEVLANDVKFIVESLGGKATITDRTPKYTYNDRQQEGHRAYRVWISMPENICPFALPRKKQAHIPKTKYQPQRIIKSIKKTKNKKTQCIYIDSKDHLYLTDNFIVTHNTLFTLQTAVNQLKQNHIDQIIISRSLVNVGREIGSLPGTLEERSKPYFMFIHAYLQDFLAQDYYKALKDNKIDIIPVEMIRGHTYHNAIMILDEAQNCDPTQIKTFISRMGHNTHCVVIGDIKQKDTYHEDNGLEFCVDHFGKNNIKGCNVVQMGYEDIKRNKYIGNILRVFDENAY